MKRVSREEVHAKFDGHCAYCGQVIELKQMQVDHMIPQSRFASFIQNKNAIPERIPKFLMHLTMDDVDHIDNLTPACRVCNKWKNDWDLEMFRSEIREQVKRLEDYSSNYRMAYRYGLIEETGKPVVFYFERNEKLLQEY